MNSVTSTKRSYLFAFCIVAVCTILARAAMGAGIERTNIVMMYLLGVVSTAIFLGKGPSVLASIMAVALFDFFCVPPYNTFAVSDSQFFITLIVMLIVALVISTLTARVRAQAQEASMRERRTATLYSMSRELSSLLDRRGIIDTGLQHLSRAFDGTCEVLSGSEPGGNHDFDSGIARWVIEHKSPAGPTTTTLPGTTTLYLPIVAANEAIGVYALKPRDGVRILLEQRQSLETMVNQVGLACERAGLAESNERARIDMKTEQLRNSLLSSVSHDLRTPLATISGAASSIIEGTGDLDAQACRELAHGIYEESVRLNRLVTNLLDMTKLQSGSLQLACELQSVDDLIGAAVTYMESTLNRTISTHVPADLPFVSADTVLIHQLLVNLIDNANKYSSKDSEIEIDAIEEGKFVKIAVLDRGPGVAEEERAKIFEKFYRAASEGRTGAGLGLAICKGIVEAHGGTIWVENRAGGGAQFQFTLPVAQELPKLNDEE